MSNWEENGFPKWDTRVTECHVQGWHIAFLQYKKKCFFPIPPTITSKYLFIFTQAWGGLHVLVLYVDPSDESFWVFLMNPMKELFGLVMINESYIVYV